MHFVLAHSPFSPESVWISGGDPHMLEFSLESVDLLPLHNTNVTDWNYIPPSISIILAFKTLIPKHPYRQPSHSKWFSLWDMLFLWHISHVAVF